MREWRNWQTRTFEGRVVIRTGSSPVSRTMLNVHNGLKSAMNILFVLREVWGIRDRPNKCGYPFTMLAKLSTT